MPNEGFTIAPEGFVSEETGEFVQTGHSITGTHNGEKTRLEEVQLQEQRWTEDEETGETIYDDRASTEDLDNLIDTYGGVEHYEEVSDWGTQHYSDEEISYWNDLVAKGDLAEIAEAMEFIKNDYEGRNEELDGLEDNTPATDDDADYIFQEIIDRDYYDELVQFAVDNLDDNYIESYNRVIEEGSREQIISTIRALNNYRNKG